jgi:hypothetical protein
VAVLAAAASAQASHEHAAEPATPRLPDGTVDLGGNGIWSQPWITDFRPDSVDKKDAGSSATAAAGGGLSVGRLVGRQEFPFLPWTKAMYEYNKATKVAYDPQGFCLPPGGPRMFGTPYPSKFIQDTRNQRIYVVFEGGAHVWREIFMDGRPHPPANDLVPSYFGHAIGKWEGDVLVVDTVGFNERTWLNFNGTMHTDALHTIERISRPNRDTLHYEAVIDDPEAYTEPWTVSWDIPWSEGEDLAEYICQDNNQFLIDLKDEFGEPFFPPTKGP